MSNPLYTPSDVDLVQDLDEKIAIVEIALDRARGELAELRRRRVALVCPYSVGDIMVNQRGERGRITAINYADNNKGYGLLGRKVKKDGANSEYNQYFNYSWDNWKKEKELEEGGQ